MVSCARCWLQKSIILVNLLVNGYGVAVIIYSLWLLKKWQLGVSVIPTDIYLHKPWFIHACLGVGIGVCLSALVGHVVTNNSTNIRSILFCTYILFIWSFLLLQIVALVIIFFRINWISYIDGNTEFKSFMKVNISICRWIVIIALVPQIYVIVLAMILWGIGNQAMNTHCTYLNIPDFRQSFLVGPNSPLPEISGHICCRNIHLIDSPAQQNLSPRFLPYIIGVFRIRFPSRTREINGG